MCLQRRHWLLLDAGRAGKCPFGLLLQHHCPLPHFLSLSRGKIPCTLTPPDLHNAPAQNSQQQQQQQQQPSTGQLGASDHVKSDAMTEAASQDAHMQSLCHLSQQRTTGCTVPHPGHSVPSPQQTVHGYDVMSTSSDSSGCMAAAEPMTQDLMVADSEDEACMQPLQAGSACFSDLMGDQTPPEHLCLNLSPDALPELRQKGAFNGRVLNSRAPHEGLEGAGTEPGLESPMPANAAAAVQALHQGSYDTLMHDTPSGPRDKAIPASFHAPDLSSPPVEAASGSKTDSIDSQAACMPTLTASVRRDASQLASHDSPGDGNSPEDGNGDPPGDACIPAGTDAVTTPAAEAVAAPISPAAGTCEIMPAGPSHVDLQAVSTGQLQQHLLDSHVPHSSVTAFLWSAVRHIVPQVLHQYTHASILELPYLTPCYPVCPYPNPYPQTHIHACFVPDATSRLHLQKISYLHSPAALSQHHVQSPHASLMIASSSCPCPVNAPFIYKDSMLHAAISVHCSINNSHSSASPRA